MARKPKPIQTPGEQFDPENTTPQPLAAVPARADAFPIGTTRFGMILTEAGWVPIAESK